MHKQSDCGCMPFLTLSLQNQRQLTLGTFSSKSEQHSLWSHLFMYYIFSSLSLLTTINQQKTSSAGPWCSSPWPMSYSLPSNQGRILVFFSDVPERLFTMMRTMVCLKAYLHSVDNKIVTVWTWSRIYSLARGIFMSE